MGPRFLSFHQTRRSGLFFRKRNSACWIGRRFDSGYGMHEFILEMDVEKSVKQSARNGGRLGGIQIDGSVSFGFSSLGGFWCGLYHRPNR